MHLLPEGTVQKPVNSQQLNSRCFSVAVLDFGTYGVKLYDPYLGVVTIPSTLKAVAARKPNTVSTGLTFAYTMSQGFRPSYEAIVISPTVLPVPPLSAKLGLPEVMVDGKTDTAYLNVSLYLKGQQPMQVTGHWLIDGAEDKDVQPITYAITTRGWQTDATAAKGLTLHLPYDKLVGGMKHTIKFVVEAPQALATDEISTWITGFLPKKNGWHFVNTGNKLDLLSWGGWCVGMSALARNAFVNGTNVSQETRPSLATIAQLDGAKTGGNIYIAGLPPLKKGIDLPRLQAYSDSNSLMINETDRLRDRLASGMPHVMFLTGQDKDGKPVNDKWTPGHAVVATAAFYCPDVFLPQQPALRSSSRFFAIYDPNYPDVSRYVGAFNIGGIYSLNFIPSPQAYGGLKYLGEYTKDN